MYLHIGNYLPAKRKHSRIAYYHRVHAVLLQLLKIFFKTVKVAVVGKHVDGNVEFLALGMRIFDRFFKPLAVKILGIGAQTELASADIHRVRSEMQSRHQLAHIAGRRQQLDSLHNIFLS